MRSLRTPLLGGIAAVGLFAAPAAFAPHAFAQSIPSAAHNSAGVASGPVVQPKDTRNGPKEPLPPAIPGAESHGEPAPAQKSALDMEPNDALFDAINRGDIATARDAINRGADLYAKNVLGMTPTELSVDLGRNDITFLLLSMRGSAGDSSLPPPSQTASLPRAPERHGKLRKGEVASAAAPAPSGDPFADPYPSPAPAEVKAAVAAPRAPRSAAPPAPVQYAGSSGAPIPQMGFLGFGGSQK